MEIYVPYESCDSGHPIFAYLTVPSEPMVNDSAWRNSHVLKPSLKSFTTGESVSNRNPIAKKHVSTGDCSKRTLKGEMKSKDEPPTDATFNQGCFVSESTLLQSRKQYLNNLAENLVRSAAEKKKTSSFICPVANMSHGEEDTPCASSSQSDLPLSSSSRSSVSTSDIQEAGKTSSRRFIEKEHDESEECSSVDSVSLAMCPYEQAMEAFSCLSMESVVNTGHTLQACLNSNEAIATAICPYEQAIQTCEGQPPVRSERRAELGGFQKRNQISASAGPGTGCLISPGNPSRSLKTSLTSPGAHGDKVAPNNLSAVAINGDLIAERRRLMEVLTNVDPLELHQRLCDEVGVFNYSKVLALSVLLPRHEFPESSLLCERREEPLEDVAVKPAGSRTRTEELKGRTSLPPSQDSSTSIQDDRPSSNESRCYLKYPTERIQILSERKDDSGGCSWATYV